MAFAVASNEKFGSNAKLYLGGLPIDITEDEIRSLLSEFGEVSEVELIKKTEAQSGHNIVFGIARMDYRHNAMNARKTLHNKPIRGSNIEVRFQNNTVVWVGDLAPHVTDELLKKAFSMFGDVERAVVATDPHTHKSRGYGFVEYHRVNGARKAITQTNEKLLLLTASARPVRVEMARFDNHEDGLKDEDIKDILSMRDTTEPHFARPGTLEFDFAMHWRELQQRQTAERNQLAQVHAAEQRQLFAAQAEHFRTEQEKLRRLEDFRRQRQMPVAGMVGAMPPMPGVPGMDFQLGPHAHPLPGQMMHGAPQMPGLPVYPPQPYHQHY